MTNHRAYDHAREQYGELGVNTEDAIRRLADIPVSLHCWQGDDVAGFEGRGDLAGGNLTGGGLAVTGNHPGRARNADELRSDLELALSLIPGSHRVNLHAIYAETGGKFVERDELGPEHFLRWIDWAKEHDLGLDFNPTFFAHPRAADGFTLAHRDAGVRNFWITHGMVCRLIGGAMGKALGRACVTNVWVPDGWKDVPADRRAPRERLQQSLDTIFAAKLDPAHQLESVESKLFGIGSEAYVVGSHEFYLGYAITRGKLLCLDTGHFHPTEVVSDKITATLAHVPGILLHVSRGLRWDSDHVVTLDDELRALALEVVRGDYLDRVRLALDYFDASINRIAAWVIGTRNLKKALLAALLTPHGQLRALESAAELTVRLALIEELKTFPLGAVWDEFCVRQEVPVGMAWLDPVRAHEMDVLRERSER